jgi:hypothetical protein
MPLAYSKTAIKKAARLLASDARIILAFDSQGMHLRKTLLVTHETEQGEVVYDTKPVVSFGGLWPRLVRTVIATMIRTREKNLDDNI